MTERQVYINITGPFGLDRRDSAVAKRASGILYELENFLIHNGNLEVREGITRQYATALNAGYRILSLFRYYGLTATEQELKEFYAAVDGASSSTIRKFNTDTTPNQWDTLTMPPGITLSPQSATSPRPPSLGNFEQFKDRVYYTNHTEPVLMIKKQDTQIYEAGIPEANAELVIDDCETTTGWAAYGETDFNDYYLDGGFDRHTEGDYGITMEELSPGATYKLVKTLTTALDLDWFYKITVGGTQRVDVQNDDGIKLVDDGSSDTSAATSDGNAGFTNAMVGSWIKNTTDGSTAIITEIISTTSVYTTKLSGGTTNKWNVGDYYTIGSYSSKYDYIAVDLFRFNKDDIENYYIELSSCPPNTSGDFAYGHRIVVYADTGFKNYDLKQRTMLAQWAINPLANTMFFGRFRKSWFIPIDGAVGSGSSGSTLVDPNANFPASVVGKTIVNLYTGYSGVVTGRDALNPTTKITTTGTGLTWTYAASPNTRYYRILDDWSAIKYLKFSMTNDSNSVGRKEARVTIDNIRLLKTPPLPAELKLQIATCDAIELWKTGIATTIVDTGLVITDDYARATEGVSCKKIPNGIWAKYQWGGTRDLSKYGTGTPWDGADTLVFDIAGQAGGLLSTIVTKVRFYDQNYNIAEAVFNNVNDWANPQQRHVYMQEFYYPLTNSTPPDYSDENDAQANDFDWTNVIAFAIKNAGLSEFVYIDNIRIQPPAASKMINKFMPLDLIVFDAISRGIEAKFGENGFVDTVVDWLFHAYADFTRQVVGQGRLVFPEYQHGRYMLTENHSLANMQMQVDAGGSLSVTFIQNNDLTEYRDFNFSLDRFWGSKQQNPDSSDQWWGVDWVEIGASDNDKFSIWMSTPDVTAISHIVFRFYANADASWKNTAVPYTHTGATGRILSTAAGHTFKQYTGLNTLVGKRIRNNTTGATGIVNWVFSDTKLLSWGITWTAGDTFTIDGYDKNNTSYNHKDGVGFKFNVLTGSLDGATGRPKPDKDNYYEYVLDVHQMFGESMQGVQKGIKKLNKYPAENEENIEAAREILNDYGVQLVYQEKDAEGKKWWKAVITFRRGQCTPHFDADNPWVSWQCIAAHEIIVRASSKKDCIVNFQDFMMTKEGAVTGTNIQYKIKLEDEMGYLGPASDASYPVTVKGLDIALADIYVPYDTRIKRKRIYRTDSTGQFRYLDTIDRLETTYLDQIPEELLGSAIEEDYYRPPRCAHMKRIDNRMAYIDCFDRRKTRRSSRIHISLPFIPHQCRDADCFDLMPEDGQKVTWIEWYYGQYIVWKERSFYTVDPDNYSKSPRDLTIGCIAPLSVASIPDGGFAWLSHEGIIFGDHTRIDKDIGEQIWPDIQNYTPQQLSHAIGWYHDRYYYIFLGYDSGVYNTRGYACYLPTGLWTYLSGWNVQCVSVWRGGTDNHEIYTGSNHGYINKLFDGEVDKSDATPSADSQITSALRTLDYDLNIPYADKYISWIIFHAKNLSTDPARKALLTFTSYYDQNPLKALDDEQVMHSYYKKYDLCQDPEQETVSTLVGFRMTGIKRYALKGMTIDVTEQGFRPFQEAGQY